MSDSENDLLTIIAEVADISREEVTGDLRFADLAGWSSVTALDLLVTLETRLRIQLDLRRFLKCETVDGLTALVSGAGAY